MSALQTIWTITRLTIREAQRRRILWVALFAAIAFLTIYGVGYRFILIEVRAEMGQGPGPGFNPAQTIAIFLMVAGLYVVHFLGIAMAALLSAGTLSGEVESHTIETLLTKPLRRWQVVLGKWLGFAIILFVYMGVMAAGIVLIARFLSGDRLDNLVPGLALIYLSALVMLGISFLGGTRLSTLANGAMAFALYSLAFIGGWVEQFGAMLRNNTAVDVGIISSLIMPADALWKRAVLGWKPTSTDMEMLGPFFVASQPSPLMTGYAVAYALVLLVLALWSFSRRDM
ncbi:MAG: ABC transporter permease subunit [Anaerolineae bacterium]|nr:ABC transporter permease subunit [Anaerolineae bacterium]